MDYGTTWGTVGVAGGVTAWGAMPFGAASSSAGAVASGVSKGGGGYYYQAYQKGIKIVAGPTGGGSMLYAGSGAHAAIYAEMRGKWKPVGQDDKVVAASSSGGGDEGGMLITPSKGYKAFRSVGEFATATGAGEGAAIASIIKGAQSGGAKGGLLAAAPAAAKYGPEIVGAAKDMIAARRDNPRVLARKLAKAKTKAAKYKAIGNKKKYRKWKLKAQMYQQMLDQLRGAESFAETSPVLAAEPAGLPSWAPWAIGAGALLLVGALAFGGKKAA